MADLLTRLQDINATVIVLPSDINVSIPQKCPLYSLFVRSSAISAAVLWWSKTLCKHSP